MDHLKILTRIREEMKKKQIDAYVIPSSDPHISEYLPDRFSCIEWVSGFTGSAGTLVITQHLAGLWTDSRYFVQAAEQLEGTGFELIRLKVQGAAEYADWLARELPKGARVAFDGKLASLALAQSLLQTLSPFEISIDGRIDLLDDIWANRPTLPKEKAYLLGAGHTGEASASKVQTVWNKVRESHADAHLISSLDDLAWVLNIRGSDVNCNPVVLGFLLLTELSKTLFIDPSKLSEEDKNILENDGIHIQPYEEVYEAVSLLEVDSIFLDPKRTCFAIYDSLPGRTQVVEGMNPSTLLKAVKNNTEIGRTREAMIKDGIALTVFFKWLEENLSSGTLSEISIAQKLQEFRSQQPDFVDISFDTIAGYLDHGALPHYKATEQSNATLKNKGLLLIDSGGQYRDGTTDITRVISLGEPTAAEKEDYTLVLKAMIEGSTCVFPYGTKGYQIDAITRKPLWDALRNYGHGTGHGVGFFLNVHEGPHVFNTANIDIMVEQGMITSIEPGLYREGQYGIRIENLVLTAPYEENQFGHFMHFETLTLCYIATDLVEKLLLEQKHIDWLNDYNARVFTELSPGLSAEQAAWLQEKTRAI